MISQDQKPSYLEFLLGMITENKKELFYNNIEQRTRYFTVVLEDIYQPHNASAVLRSCDFFGVQDVHIIESKNRFRVIEDIDRGSSKWLTMNIHQNYVNNTQSCIDKLKSNGYRIIATSPHTSTTKLEDFNVNQPFALFFGHEKKGLSPAVFNSCDEVINIPSCGLTESLNLSVSAAICIHYLNLKLRTSEISWGLSNNEKLDLLIDWAHRITGNEEFFKSQFMMQK